MGQAHLLRAVLILFPAHPHTFFLGETAEVRVWDGFEWGKWGHLVNWVGKHSQHKGQRGQRHWYVCERSWKWYRFTSLAAWRKGEEEVDLDKDIGSVWVNPGHKFKFNMLFNGQSVKWLMDGSSAVSEIGMHSWELAKSYLCALPNPEAGFAFYFCFFFSNFNKTNEI